MAETHGSRRLVPRVAHLFRPYRGRVAVVCGAILLASGIGVVNPLLIKVVFDRVISPTAEGPDSEKMRVLLWSVGVMITMPMTTNAK